jgi:sugar phosphate isomerase/epimerase
MKFSVFTVMLPDLIPEEAAKEIKNAGYEGVEWRVTFNKEERKNEPPSFWGNNLCTLNPTEEDAQRAKKLAESYGLEAPVLGTYISLGDVQTIEKAIQFAKTTNTRQIRVGVWKFRNATYAELFEQAKTFLKEIEEMSRLKGIRILIEIHHQSICPSASSTYRLVSLFDPEYVGVIFDPGNMVFEGFEDYRLGLELLGPYLAHIHLKNALFKKPEDSGIWKARWSPLENGVVNFPKLIKVLKEIGYQGWLSMEDFSKARPSREALKHNIEFIRNILESQ